MLLTKFVAKFQKRRKNIGSVFISDGAALIGRKGGTQRMPKSLAAFQFAVSLAAIYAGWLLSPKRSGGDSPLFWSLAFFALGLKYLVGGLFVAFAAKFPSALTETLGGLALFLFALGNRHSGGIARGPSSHAMPVVLLVWGVVGLAFGFPPSVSSHPVYFAALFLSLLDLRKYLGGLGGGANPALLGFILFLSALGLAGRSFKGYEIHQIFAVSTGWLFVAFIAFGEVSKRAASRVAKTALSKPKGAALLDFSARIVYIDEKLASFLGTGAVAAIGRPATVLFGPYDGERFSAWLFGGGQGEFSPDGTGQGVRLRAVRSFFGHILFAAGAPPSFSFPLANPTALLRIDPESGSILSCDQTARELLGLEDENRVGRSFWSIAGAGQSARLRELVGLSAANGGAFGAKLKGPRGEFGAILRAQGGRSGNRQTLDIHIAEGLADGPADDFHAAGVAHDLGNILQAIVACCEGAGEAGGGREALERAKKTALRGGELARKLAAPHPEDSGSANADLSKVAGAVGEAAGPTFSGNITFKAEIPPGLPQLSIDPSHLEQVLLNLVVNARDALGGREGGEIRISAEAVGRGRVAVFVADNGPGVADGEEERIFAPFYSTKGADKGSGLGLAVSRALVERHGGSLEFVRGGGATFRITLPSAHPEIRRILVADPDPLWRAIISEALSRRGFEAVLAGDGLEAARKLEGGEEGCAGLVTELLLPALGGKKLLELAAARNVSAFVSTSVDLEEAREGARRAGAAGFALKPDVEPALAAWLGGL